MMKYDEGILYGQTHIVTIIYTVLLLKIRVSVLPLLVQLTGPHGGGGYTDIKVVILYP